VNVIVTDRESIESGIVVRTRYVVVSIRDKGRRKARVPKQAGLADVLFLQFDDAEPSRNMELPASIRLMRPADAEAVWDFVGRHQKSVGTIVVHCEQGMSRSPAVAAAIAKKLGLDDRRFWEEHQPNRFVYDLMLKYYPDALPRGPT
jgi:predicted protein tyrosine phosphatase